MLLHPSLFCMLNETTQLQIWDTAGEQQADLLDSLFWGNAAGAMIVCNLLQADCISALEFWQDRLHQARSKGLLKCLISLTFPSAETHHILHLHPAGTHASLHVSSSQCLVKANSQSCTVQTRLNCGLSLAGEPKSAHCGRRRDARPRRCFSRIRQP